MRGGDNGQRLKRSQVDGVLKRCTRKKKHHDIARTHALAEYEDKIGVVAQRCRAEIGTQHMTAPKKRDAFGEPAASRACFRSGSH